MIDFPQPVPAQPAPAQPAQAIAQVVEDKKDDEESEESDYELQDGEEMRLCDICYEEYPASRFFGLKCGHQFCKLCMKDHLKANILDGNVIRIPCMMDGCEEEFLTEDV